MKHLQGLTKQSVTLLAVVLLSACASDGRTVFTDDHQVNVLTSSEDSKPLSNQVRTALKNHSRTMHEIISVAQDSPDTVKLTGHVNDDSVRHEAERIAYGVSGVRFVVNNLYIRD